MHSIACLTISCILTLLMMTSSIRAADGMEQVRIGGTGGLLAVMHEVASGFEKTHPGIDIVVLPSMGSSGGIKAVLAGALDIGLSSRNLKEGEHTAVARLYARTPFTFAVSNNNKVSGFTIKELEDIYESRTDKWPDGHPIRIILRPSVEFDTMMLKSISPRMDKALAAALVRQGMIVAITDQDSADALGKIPYALGTITLGQLIAEKRFLKPLSLNGVKPDLSNMIDGKYPYFKTYYLIIKPKMKLAAREFVDFACSARATNILNRSGYQSFCR